METITEKPHWLDGSTAGFVSKSFDKDWPKWGVCYPQRATRWFDTKEKADSVLAEIRKSVVGYGVPA